MSRKKPRQVTPEEEAFLIEQVAKAKTQVDNSQKPEVVVARSGMKFNGLPPITFTENKKQVVRGAQNRKGLIMRAGRSNSGAIWLGAKRGQRGIPLYADDSWPLESGYDLDVYSHNTDNVLYLMSQDEQ